MSAMTDRIAVLDASGWSRIGEPSGSTPGGVYLDRLGDKWYLKHARTEDHARSEVLANRLYRLAGAAVAQVELAICGNRLAVASRIVKGVTLAEMLCGDDGRLTAAVCAHFAADAWLANRDVLGTDLDNILIDGNGLPVRIDQGGALQYRAQGSTKRDFAARVVEFDTLRDPRTNAVAATLFGAMTSDDLLASLRHVTTLDAAAIGGTVGSVYGEGTDATSLADLLIARRDDLAGRAQELVTG